MTTADPNADKAFLDFHAANPMIYKVFVSFARQAKAAGAKALGAKAVWERMRWSFAVENAPGGEGYVFNNNYVSRYARLAMMKEPDLAGMFETRRLKVAPGELDLKI